MADAKISELDAADDLDAADLFVIVKGSDNAKLTGTQLGAFITSALAVYPQHGGFIAGNWYNPWPHGELAAGSALPGNSIRFFPFVLPRPMTVSDLGCRITTRSAGNNIQLAIYGSVAATGLPTGNALAVTGSISTSATGALSADITGSNVLLPGGELLWAAINSDNAVVVMQIVAGTSGMPGFWAGTTSLANVTFASTGGVFIRTYAQTFNTWPDMTGQATVVANANTYGLVFLKAA